MKKFAVSTILAGGLLAAMFGSAGAANAAEVFVGPDGSGVTVFDGSGQASVSLPLGTGASIGRDGANASLPLNLGDANINRDGINGTLPFGTGASIGRDGANASLPFGIADANIKPGGRS